MGRLMRGLLVVLIVLILGAGNSSAKTIETSSSMNDQIRSAVDRDGLKQIMQVAEISAASPPVQPTASGIISGGMALQSIAVVVGGAIAAWSLARVLVGPSVCSSKRLKFGPWRHPSSLNGPRKICQWDFRCSICPFTKEPGCARPTASSASIANSSAGPVSPRSSQTPRHACVLCQHCSRSATRNG